MQKCVKILETSLFMILLNVRTAFAKDSVVAISTGVNEGKVILKMGVAIIFGYVILGFILTVGGWLLDTLGKPKIKIYMEISIYLLAMLIPIVFFTVIFYQIKSISTM